MLKLLLALIPLVSAATEPGYDVIVVAGQSNAVGIGCGPSEDASRARDGQIFQLDPNGFVIQAREPLLHAPQHGRGGKGFGMTFARLYAEGLEPGRKVLLVPVALGGTSILQWDDRDEGYRFGPPTQNTDPLPNDSTELHDTMLRQIRRALRAETGSRVVAFLWHQGETDLLFMSQPRDPIHAAMGTVAQYRARLEALVARVRAAIPEQHFPFLVGELGRFFEPAFPGANGLTAFNQMLASVATATPAMAVASSEGLGNGVAAHCAVWPQPSLPDGDPVHFHAQAQVELGRRYFSAYRRVNNHPAVF